MQFSAITFFNEIYLNRGIALVISALQNNSELTQFFIQTLDEESYRVCNLVFKDSSRIKIFSPSSIESDLKEVNEISYGSEVFFMIKPICILRCIQRERIKGNLIYFDADLFFFQSLKLPNRNETSSVLLSKHIFAKRTVGHSQYGIYNAGFISFQLDEDESLAFVEEWLSACLEEIKDRKPGISFSDQVVLNQIADRSKHINFFSDMRINQSLWSIGSIFDLPSRAKAKLLIDQCMVYHFHGFYELENSLRVGIRRYGLTSTRKISLICQVYIPYIIALWNVRAKRGFSEKPLVLWRVFLSILLTDKVKLR